MSHDMSHDWYLLYVLLSCPSEGTGVVATEYKHRVIIRMGIRRVEHGTEDTLVIIRYLYS